MSFAEVSQPVLVWTGRVMLAGSIAIPEHASAAVIVVSAPTLPNPARDERLNDELTRYGVATLYVSLLTEEEQQFDSTTHQYRFDSDFLEQRLVEVVAWVKGNENLKDLPTGVVATSGSAAAAICMAAERPGDVKTVVSIDGRTDLAIDCLREIKTPTLLVVSDMPVLRMNREALTLLRGEKRFEILHGEDVDIATGIAQRTVLWLADKLALTPADAWAMV